MANYAPPAAYSFGNARRNLEKGPGAAYFGPGILKNFPLHGERTTLQFRAEFFNFLNQHAVSHSFISSSYGASEFGTAYGTQQTSREVQLALKLLFSDLRLEVTNLKMPPGRAAFPLYWEGPGQGAHLTESTP
jgi:hypothetical protein